MAPGWVIDYATHLSSLLERSEAVILQRNEAVIQGESVPESKTRKAADAKQRLKAQRESRPKNAKGAKVKAPSSRRWVPPTFITVGLLGVIWLITFYVAGPQVPGMSALGNWNVLIGMGAMAASFGIATLWK